MYLVRMYTLYLPAGQRLAWWFKIQAAPCCRRRSLQQGSQQSRVVWCSPARNRVPWWCSAETLPLNLLIQAAQVTALRHLGTRGDKSIFFLVTTATKFCLSNSQPQCVYLKACDDVCKLMTTHYCPPKKHVSCWVFSCKMFDITYKCLFFLISHCLSLWAKVIK